MTHPSKHRADVSRYRKSALAHINRCREGILQSVDWKYFSRSVRTLTAGPNNSDLMIFLTAMESARTPGNKSYPGTAVSNAVPQCASPIAWQSALASQVTLYTFLRLVTRKIIVRTGIPETTVRNASKAAPCVSRPPGLSFCQCCLGLSSFRSGRRNRAFSETGTRTVLGHCGREIDHVVQPGCRY